jgi:hypothetical protein
VIDSSGFETRHASRHYRIVIRDKDVLSRGWPKISLCCEPDTHMILGAHVTQGPSSDYGEFAPLLVETTRNIKPNCVLADAGYDSERNHEFARHTMGIRSTVIPARRHKSGILIPKTRYRRQMRLRFSKRIYRARVQVESVFSRIKRVLGARIRARRWPSQERECYLKILTFNLMLLGGVEKP